MDGPSERVASPITASVSQSTGATATRSQVFKPTWEHAPDAGESTCVSGSEGSIPGSNQQKQQKQCPQEQEQYLEQKRMQRSKQDGETLSLRISTPCSGAATLSQADGQPQQIVHQQSEDRLRLHAATITHSQVAHASRSSDRSDCGLPSLPAPAATPACLGIPQAQMSSSSSSSCSASSIGGDLRGLISALAAADTNAGGGDLQQLLQQLLAERDLYKAAFSAAKEELKDLEGRQQQLTQILQNFEQERVQQQQQLEPAEPTDEAPTLQDRALHWNTKNSSSMQQQLVDGVPASGNCSSAEGPYTWLQQLHACVAGGTYPRPDLLQKSVEQQQQLIRLAEGLQQERESYVEAVACLHSQLREAREDVSLYMSAHATHAADLTAESDEALRAADLWLQYSLRAGTKCKFWGLGSVLHSHEAAAASAARTCNAPAVRAFSSSVRAEVAAAAAAAVVTEEPPPGASVAFAAAASVFGVQDESMGDDAGSSGTVTAAAGDATAPTTELERLWWERSSDVFVERQQLREQHRQRERNNRLLWFLE